MFLDARHQRYLEEGSSCNLFFVLSDGRLVTPELGDTVLAGITRRTVIELAAERGIPVEEREQVFGDGAIGPVAHAFRSRLKGVRYGALEDRYGWTVPVAAAGDGAGDAAGAAAAAVAAEGVAAAEGAAAGSAALAGTARG